MDVLKDRQTKLIKMMRFPLIVMVLYVHATRPVGIPMEWSFCEDENFTTQ
mgnify:CR=1 FL=1